jgi:exopolysaccharide production protein ExoZ
MTYVWGLDLIRFAAALMVVVFHFSWQQPDPQVSFSPGWVGVEIFFVISGFVIMGSACKATPVEFLERRFAGYTQPLLAALW